MINEAISLSDRIKYRYYIPTVISLLYGALGGGKMLFSNLLRSLEKPVEFGQTHSVTAVIITHMFTMERFIDFYYELGLKEIQSVLRSRHCLGT